MPISLISTLTEDILMNEQGGIISTAQGGPGLFIRDALSAEDVPFELIEGDRLKVEILVTPRGEFGKVSQKPRELSINTDWLNGWSIISSVVGEWQFPNNQAFSGHVFVDLQGFVRDGTNFGGKKLWNLSASIASQIFCMKGTAQEIKYLPPPILEDQKQRILIVSDGRKGVELYVQGQHRHFEVTEEINGLKNTIGAGDTLLGHFAAQLYKDVSPYDGIQAAIASTSRFLKAKLSQR